MSPSRFTWLITPNHAEAAALAEADADDPDLLTRLAERLGGPAILLKDGHGGDPERCATACGIAGVVHTLARRVSPAPTRAAPAAPSPPRSPAAWPAVARCCTRSRPAWPGSTRSARWTHPGSDGRPHLPDAGPPLPA
jgi:hypothetical protein